MRDEIIKKYEDIDSWWQAENQKLKEKLSIAVKGLEDMADGKIPYTSFGWFAKQILEQIKEY